MSSTIGRAGKQVFIALEHGQVTPKSQSATISSPPYDAHAAHPTHSSIVASYPTNEEKTNQSSHYLTTKEYKSRVDVDLDETLAELHLLEQDSHKYNTTLSPLREEVSPPPANFTSMKPEWSEKHALIVENSFFKPEMSKQLSMMTGIDSSTKVEDLEKDQLLAALQVLKMQNQMLTHKIERDQQESKLQVEFERQQRVNAVNALEKENQNLIQQLTHSKSEAEKKLDFEKRHFEATLKAIESEKQALQTEVGRLQTESQAEIALLTQEKNCIEKQALTLEIEKEKMFSQVLQLEALKDNGAQEEVEMLRVKIHEMELEKQNLSLQMSLRSQQIQSKEDEVAEQMKIMNKQAAEKLRQYEAEKSSASTAVEQASQGLQSEIKKYNHYLQHDHDIEKTEAASKNKEESTASSPVTSPSTSAPKSFTREAAKQKAKLLQDKLKQRKLHRVNRSVHRMKSHWEQEKQKSQQNSNNSSMNSINQNNADNDAPITPTNSTSNGKKKKLSTRKSLVDMMNILHNDYSDDKQHPEEEVKKCSIYHINISSSVNNSKPSDQPPVKSKLQPQIPILDHASSAKDHVFSRQKTIMDLDSDDDDDDTRYKQKDNGNNEENEQKDTEENTSDGQELPPFHTLVMNNSIDKVRIYVAKDPAVLDLLDESSRYAVFYAAVYGHLNMLILLFSLYSSNISHVMCHPDMYGDTLVHASTCSNNTAVLDLILNKVEKVLKKGEGEGDSERLSCINHQNSYGMTAAHMCSTEECLELLYKNGASMSVVDNQFRSPLFIYCFINNESCTNYLLNCVDSNDFTYLVDHHGDTPLHAAACNGSIDCLLALLSHGYDPRLLNYQNLKAIDLAIRNKHTKCIEMLAEYNLHFCTSSEFDSVLFLAVLEGHRFIAQNIHKLPPPSQTTSSSPLPNVNSPTATVTPLPKLLNKDRVYSSMFSLRDTKVMKIESFGSWLAFHDPNSEQVFWYSAEQQTGQWELPSSVLSLYHQQRLNIPLTDNEEDAEENALSLSRYRMLTLCRKGDWVEYTSNNSPVFYYNEKNGSFTWSEPYHTNPAHAEEHASDGHYDHNYYSTSDWVPYYDYSTGSVYWYQAETGESQWENPYPTSYSNEEVVQMAVRNSQQREGGREGREERDEEHEVERVHDVHSLF